MPNSIKLVECPRDAWQGLKHRIPTHIKVEYLRALIAAGFKHIDAVSFVSSKAVPQMADSEEVLKLLDAGSDVEIIGIVVNEEGADRAIAAEKVTTLGFPYSLSPTFLKQNQNQTLEEAYDVLEKIKGKADQAGLGTVAYISMAFGNPYGDLWNEEEIIEGVRNLSELGIETVSLADTVGLSDVNKILEILKPIIQEFSELEIGVHLHSRRQNASEKIKAAYAAGCRRFDSALGGFGGCPFAQDELVGNIPTEIVIDTLGSNSSTLPQEQLDRVLRMSSEIAQGSTATI